MHTNHPPKPPPNPRKGQRLFQSIPTDRRERRGEEVVPKPDTRQFFHADYPLLKKAFNTLSPFDVKAATSSQKSHMLPHLFQTEHTRLQAHSPSQVLETSPFLRAPLFSPSPPQVADNTILVL